MPRQRKDLAIHKLQNTTCVAAVESDVQVGRPKYPKNISAEAKATFKRLVKLLENRRACTAGDSEILRLYAVAFDRHSRALAHLADEGEIIIATRCDNNGNPHEVQKANGWLEVATTAEKFMRGCLSDLGLNPLQRSKVRPTKEPPTPEEQDFPTRAEMAATAEEIDLNSIDTEKVM
jgi:P27 family predicted phage terminase small subunit